MARKVLGIDIGSDSVKFVQIEKPLRGKAVIRAVRKKISAESVGDSTAIGELIKNTVAQSSLSSDDYAISIPPRNILLRETELPFKDRSKIDHVLKFNIEQTIPFQPEDVIADFIIDAITGEGSKITAIVVKKEEIKKSLDLLALSGIEPRVVSCSSCCAGMLVESGGLAEKEGAVALVDIGAASVSLSVYFNGKLRFIKFIGRGSRAITEAIAVKLGKGFEEAEELKCGAVIHDDGETGNSEQDIVIETIKKMIKKIVQDLALAIASYNSKHSDGPVHSLYLTGGGAQVNGISSLFQKYIGVQASVLKPIPGFTFDAPSDDPLQPCYNTALSLALSELPVTGRRVNFRKEEFTYKWVDTALKNNLKYAAVFAGAIVFLYIVNSVFSFVQVKKENTVLNNKMLETYRAMIPEGKVVNVVVQSQQSLKELKEKSAKFKNVIDQKINPLDIIKEISSGVESGWNIKTQNCVFREDKIDISGEGKSIDDIKKLEKKLLDSGLFENVVLSDSKMNEVKKVAEFTIELKLPRQNGTVEKTKAQ